MNRPHIRGGCKLRKWKKARWENKLHLCINLSSRNQQMSLPIIMHQFVQKTFYLNPVITSPSIKCEIFYLSFFSFVALHPFAVANTWLRKWRRPQCKSFVSCCDSHFNIKCEETKSQKMTKPENGVLSWTHLPNSALWALFSLDVYVTLEQPQNLKYDVQICMVKCNICIF